MYTLNATAQTIFEGAPVSGPTSHGLARCQRYRVHSASGISLIFIGGITGTDESEATHWATIAEGDSAIFESDAGIATVKAKSTAGASLNAFPLAYKIP